VTGDPPSEVKSYDIHSYTSSFFVSAFSGLRLLPRAETSVPRRAEFDKPASVSSPLLNGESPSSYHGNNPEICSENASVHRLIWIFFFIIVTHLSGSGETPLGDGIDPPLHP